LPGSSGPAHAKRISSGSRLAHAGQLLLGELTAHVARVLLDQAQRLGPLVPGHLGEGEAGGRREAVRTAGAADDVAERLGRDDAAGALRVAEAPRERAAQVLLRGEDALALLGTRRNLGRVGAEEGGRHRDRPAGHEREVERQVMALDPPAPRGRRAWIAEDGERVVVRVPHETEGLEAAQHFLEADDPAALP
jgi:hypothetical protein